MRLVIALALGDNPDELVPRAEAIAEASSLHGPLMIVASVYAGAGRFDDADGEWTYFRLNLAPLSPVNGDPSRHREELTELAPGTYEERSLLDGHDVTASARGVSRWFKGAFVIFAKGSTYNLSPSTYDGRHSLGRKYKETTADAFRTYIEKVIEGLAASRTASPNARAPSP